MQNGYGTRIRVELVTHAHKELSATVWMQLKAEVHVVTVASVFVAVSKVSTYPPVPSRFILLSTESSLESGVDYSCSRDWKAATTPLH